MGKRIPLQMISFREFIEESIFRPHNAHVMWKHAAPFLAHQLSQNPHGTAKVNANDVHPDFPKDLSIEARMGAHHHASFHTGLDDASKCHAIRMQIPHHDNATAESIHDEMKSPITSSFFVHEHEHYKDHEHDIKHHGPEKALAMYDDNADASKEINKGNEKPYYSNKGETRAYSSQLAYLTQKKYHRSDNSPVLDKLVQHGDSHKVGQLKDYVTRRERY